MNLVKIRDENILVVLNQTILDQKLNEVFDKKYLSQNDDIQLHLFLTLYTSYIEKYFSFPPIDCTFNEKFKHFLFEKYLANLFHKTLANDYAKLLIKVSTICYFLLLNNELYFIPVMTQFLQDSNSFRPKYPQDFIRLEKHLDDSSFLSVFEFALNNSKVPKEIKQGIQKEKALSFRPTLSIYNLSMTVARALFEGAVYLELKNYLGQYRFFENKETDPFQDAKLATDFLKVSLDFMAAQYQIQYVQSLNDLLEQNISNHIDKFNTENAFLFVQSLLEFSTKSNATNFAFIFQLFITTFANLFKIADEKLHSMLTEALIRTFQQIKNSEDLLHILTDSFFNDWIKLFNGTDSEIILDIVSFLDSRELLPNSKSLYSYCVENPFLYFPFFNYIKEELPPSFINELFNMSNLNKTIENVSIDKLTCQIMIKLLQDKRFDSNSPLDLIFKSILDHQSKEENLYQELLSLSKEKEYEQPLFLALSNIFETNSVDYIALDSLFVCQIMSTINRELMNGFPLDKLSEKVCFDVDAVFIPQIFHTYTFLPISDASLYWDLAVHSSLFYKQIEPFAVQLKDELLNSDEFSINLGQILLHLYDQLNDSQYFLRAVIVAYSLDTENVSRYLHSDLLRNLGIEEKNDDKLLNLINLIKSKFNEILIDPTFVENIIKIFDDGEYFDPLSEFLSEIDFENRIDINYDYSPLFDDQSIADSNAKKALLIIILHCQSNHERLQELLDSDMIEELFTSESNFPQSAISMVYNNNSYLHDLNEPELEVIFLLSICENNNYQAAKYIASRIPISIDSDFLYTSIPSIIELLFKQVPIQEELSKIDDILTYLNNCTTLQQFEISFMCLMDRQPQTSTLVPYLLQIVLSNKFPAILRNSIISQYVMKKIAILGPELFLNNYKGSSYATFSLYRPATEYPLLQSFASFGDLIQKLAMNSNYKDLAHALTNLKLSPLPNLNFSTDQFQTLKKSLGYFHSYLADEFGFSIFSYHHSTNAIFFSLYQAQKSVYSSLSQELSKSIIEKGSKILILDLTPPISTDNFIIEDKFDVSDFTENEMRYPYTLSSLITEKNNVYLPLQNNQFLYCKPNENSIVTSISESISQIIYSQRDGVDDYQLFNSLQPKDQISNKLIFMQLLHDPLIDWTLFMENCPDFLDLAVTLIQNLKIKQLFKILSNNTEFCDYFLLNRIDVLNDLQFTKLFSNEIIQTCKNFTNNNLCSILCHNVIQHNPWIVFTILTNLDISIQMKKELIPFLNDKYDSDEYRIFVHNLVDQLTQNEFNEAVMINQSILITLLKISDKSHIDRFNPSLLTNDLFAVAAPNSKHEFLCELLIKCKGDPDFNQKLKLSASILFNDERYQSMVIENHSIPNDLETISRLLQANSLSFVEFVLNELRKIYPPETTINPEIPNILHGLLVKTHRYEEFAEVVYDYRNSLQNRALLSGPYLAFTFSHKPSMLKKFDKLGQLLLALPKPTDQQLLNVITVCSNLSNYSDDDRLKLYELLFRIIGKFNFLHLITNYTEFFDNVYQSIQNKKELPRLFLPLINDNCNHIDAVNLFSAIYHYPDTLAVIIDKLCSFKFLSHTYLFSIYFGYSLDLFSKYRRRALFYSSIPELHANLAKILRTINNMIETVILSDSYIASTADPFNYSVAIYEYVYMRLTYMQDKLHLIHVLESFGNEVRIEFLRLLRNIIYTLPATYELIITRFIENSRSLYNDFDLNCKLAFSNFICDVFREGIGDRQLVPSPNTLIFKTTLNFFTRHFRYVLLLDTIEYCILKPYLLIIQGMLNIQAASGTFLKNDVMTYLYRSKEILVPAFLLKVQFDNDDDFTEFSDFLSFLISSVPQIITAPLMNTIIPQLNRNNTNFRHQVELIDLVLRKLSSSILYEVANEQLSFIETFCNNENNEESLNSLLALLVQSICGDSI